MSLKVIKLIEKGFDVLPPHVVINDILSFYLLKVNLRKRNIRVFVCFGYFTRDHLRHIWFCFRSVHFSPWSGFFETYYAFPKIQALITKDFLQFHLLEKINFWNMESLKIKSSQYGVVNPDPFLSKKFPRLRYLYVSSEFSKCKGWNVDNLKKLWVLKLKKIKAEQLTIFDNPYDNLKVLHLKKLQQPEINKFTGKNLEVLHIIKCFNLDDSIFMKSMPKLKILMLKFLHVNGTHWAELDSLEQLTLICCHNLNDFFLKGKRLPKLHTLELIHMIQISDEFLCPLSIKTLNITDCIGITDKFFSTRMFWNLGELKLKLMPQLVGRNWYSMPKLKKYTLPKTNIDKLVAKVLFPWAREN